MTDRTDTKRAIENLTYSLKGPSTQAWVQKADIRLLLAENQQMRERLAFACLALLRDGYFKPGEISDDIAPRITELASHLRGKLAAIEALEVHGREFVDAAELYRILDKPIPPPIDHAANIRRINYPEIDYPQELRDQHQSWAPQVQAMIDSYGPAVEAIIDGEETEHGLAKSQWAPKDCTCPWPWPIGDRHVRTSCPARPE